MKHTTSALVLSMAVLASCDEPCSTSSSMTEVQSAPSTTSTTCTAADIEYATPAVETTSCTSEYTTAVASTVSTTTGTSTVGEYMQPAQSTTSTEVSIEYASPTPETTTCTSTTTKDTILIPSTSSTTCISTNGEATSSVPSTTNSMTRASSNHGSLGLPTDTARSSLLPPYPLNNGTVASSAAAGPGTARPSYPVYDAPSNSTGLRPFVFGNMTINGYPNHTSVDNTTLGYIPLDGDGNPVPMKFGMYELLGLFDDTPFAAWRWPELPEPGHPVTHPTDEFTDTTCTGERIDAYEEHRAARHLHHFCNRWQVKKERLYATTSGKTTLFLCAWQGTRNCSLALWRAASAHLDRECGIGGTGYVHLRMLRLGRERPSENVTFCPELSWSPLFDYRINQREVLADGRPYEEWRILNRRKQAKLDYAAHEPHDSYDGNSSPP